MKDLGYSVLEQRAQAFNVLDFGAVSICMSARFAYNSSLHPRVFRGNVYVNYSIVFVIVTQVFLTYCPYLNDTIFGMSGMDGIQWGICAMFTAVVYLVMEAEKFLLRYLQSLGKDTDDLKDDYLFDDKMENAPKGTHLLDETKLPQHGHLDLQIISNSHEIFPTE